MIPGVSASLSALSAFGRKLGISARNLANCNTDGYKREDARITGNAAGLPDVTLVRSGSPGALVEEDGVMKETSNVDLACEFPQMMLAQRGYEANLKALKAEGEVMDSILDILV